MKKSKSKRQARLTASKFEALPDEEKDRIYNEIDAQAQTLADRAKPLTAWQKKAWSKAKKRMGRPRLGKDGAKIVSVTVEKDLLKRADTYARANGMKRSELFALSVREKIGA